MVRPNTSQAVGPQSWEDKADQLGIDANDGAPVEDGGAPAEVELSEEEQAAADEQARLDAEAADEAAAAAEAEADDDEPLSAVVPGLTPGAQKAFNKRVGKSVARRKAAEEKAAEAEARAEEAEAKAAAAEERLADQSRSEAVALGIHPDYLKPGEAEFLKEEKKLASDLKWFTQQYGEDYVGTGTAESPQLTAAQVNRMWAEASSKHSAVAGRAATIRARAQLAADEERQAGRAARKKPGARRVGAQGAAPQAGQRRAAVPPATIRAGAGARRPIASAGARKKPGFTKEQLDADPTPANLERYMTSQVG